MVQEIPQEIPQDSQRRPADKLETSNSDFWKSVLAEIAEIPPTSSDLYQAWKVYLPQLEVEGKEQLSWAELNESLKRPSVEDGEALFVATMRHFHDRFHSVGVDVRPIFPSDVAEFDRKLVTNSSKNDAALAKFLDQKFNKLNSDGDDGLSKKELQAASHDKSLSPTDRKLAGEALNQFAKISESAYNDTPHENEITRRDITKFSDTYAIDRQLKFYHKELRETDRHLYGKFENPLSAITPSAIRQGETRDAIFLAALGSLAATNPSAIEKMISTDGHGNYVVKFPGVEKSITVTPPTDGELLVGANGKQWGLWPAVIEKAWSKYNDLLAFQKNPLKIDQDLQEPTDRQRDVFEALLGPQYELVKMAKNVESVKHQLDMFKSSKMPIVASTVHDDWFTNPRASELNGDFRQSSFSVIDYDAAAGIVTIRNTWGDRVAPDVVGEEKTPHRFGENREHNGVLRLSVAEFAKNIDIMYVPKKQS